MKAALKLCTLKPVTAFDASKIIKVLMTKVNKPRVKIFKGRVKRSRTGLMKAFKKPKIKETITAVKNPSTLTCGVK